MTNKALKALVKKWTNGTFELVQGYYIGRGPVLTDLDCCMLMQIYRGLAKEIGQDEADKFADMIGRMENLSAECFIFAFQELVKRDFFVNEVFTGPHGKLIFDDVGVVMKRDEVTALTARIRDVFMLDHKHEKQSRK